MFLPVCGVPLTEDRKRRCARMFLNAVPDAGLTLLQAAQEAERDPRQVSRQLQGDEGSLTTLFKQPDEYWRALWVQIALEFGPPDKAKHAWAFWRLARARRRQARMDARTPEERRTA